VSEDGPIAADSRPPAGFHQMEIHGYDIHVVFEAQQEPQACELFDQFRAHLAVNEIPHDRDMVFSEPVGPWPTPMWQVLLPQSDRVDRDLGICISWLMLNRGPFSVMVHPNTVKSDGSSASYEDHSTHMLWLGPPQDLRLEGLV
jgi:aromatic ring-cleaving dioxygenase